MSIPEHLWRFPTAGARVHLAWHLELQYEEWMQDWEWQVADAGRIDEFLRLYESGDLGEDEQFSLMEIIIQSVEDSETALANNEWQRILQILDEKITLHAYSVWYWSVPDEEDQDAHWRVTPDLRLVLEKHRPHLARQTGACPNS